MAMANKETQAAMETMIGVSVVHIKTIPYLRLSMRPHHMKSLGTPKKVDIRGTTRDGLLIAPGKAYTPYKVGANLLYVQFTLSQFEGRLSGVPRSTIWMRPTIANGHIQLPGAPDGWISAESEFLRGAEHDGPHIYEPGPRTVQVSPFPGDPPAVVKAQAVEVPGRHANGAANGHTPSPTAPLPKPQVPDYQVPGSMREMEAVLSGKIDEVRNILRAMEEKTGLQFVLDRNLRVVVNLRPRDK